MSYEEDIIVCHDDTEEVKRLKRRVMSLEAQLEGQKQKSSKLMGGELLKTEAIDLYPGEQLDFLISILEQVKKKCPEGSRALDIVNSILMVNEPVGRGEEIVKSLDKVFKKNEPLNKSDISMLNSLGFTYVQSRKHPKLRFGKDGKYAALISSTPSDGRSGLNTISRICNTCIAASIKI